MAATANAASADTAPLEVDVDLELFVGKLQELVREKTGVDTLFETIYHAARLAGPAVASDTGMPGFAPQEARLSTTMVLGFFEYYLLHYLGLPASAVAAFLEAAAARFSSGSERVDERLCSARKCSWLGLGTRAGCPGHLHVTEPLSAQYHQEMAASLYSVLMSEVGRSPITHVRGSLLVRHCASDPRTDQLEVLQLAFYARLARPSPEKEGDAEEEEDSAQLVVLATADPLVSAGVLPLLYMLRNDLNETLRLQRGDEEDLKLPEIEILHPERSRVAAASALVADAIEAALPSLSPAVLLSELACLPHAALSNREELVRYLSCEAAVGKIAHEAEEKQLRELEEELAILTREAERGDEPLADLSLRMALRDVDWECDRLAEVAYLLESAGGEEKEKEREREKEKEKGPTDFQDDVHMQRLRSVVTGLLTTAGPAPSAGAGLPAVPCFLSSLAGSRAHRALATLLARRYLHRQRAFLAVNLCCVHWVPLEEWDVRFCFFQRHSQGAARAVFIPPLDRQVVSTDSVSPLL